MKNVFVKLLLSGLMLITLPVSAYHYRYYNDGCCNSCSYRGSCCNSWW